jgi:hypothetical protein
MDESRNREMDFFRQHSSYKELENIGTPYLSKKLSNHLISEILKQLPSIQAFIDTRWAGGPGAGPGGGGTPEGAGRVGLG